MKTNLLMKTLLTALLLAAAQPETPAATLLADGTFDHLPVGTTPDPGAPVGHWGISAEPVASGISIAPAPAGGTGNALRVSIPANSNTDLPFFTTNHFAKSLTTASGGILDVSFDVYVEPGVEGPSIYIGNGSSTTPADYRGPQFFWQQDGKLITFERSKFPDLTTLIESYPRSGWQTVRLEVDVANARFNFYWSEKGQPVSVIRTNLGFHSPGPHTIRRISIGRFAGTTAAVGFYIDNLQVSSGPPAAVTPALSIVAPGASVTLSPTNTLDVSSTYQWQLHGTNLPGATSSNLALSNLTFAQSGPYSVIVSNEYEVVTATAARVEVVDRVAISSQPSGTTVISGTNVTLSVAAVSPLPISYQWQFNGTDLPGQTGATLTLNNVQAANEGLYTVVATDALRSVTSEPATLTVWVRPVIVQAPLSQSVVAGGSVTFSVEIAGNPAPFLYQWRQASTTLTNMVQTGKQAFLTLNNVRTNQAGLYRVVITNAASPSLTVNATWNLTVLPDTDGDGLPDAWETAHGLSPTDAADAALDLDGDGQSNATEYRSGTSPADAASCLKLDGVTKASGAATLRFNAVSNQTYTVEWCADLGGGTWTKLTDIIGRPSNRTETVTDGHATDAARFYRLLTPRQP